MFGHLYYNGIIRNYIVVFGTLFNEIFIQRNDSSNNVVDEFKVPLSYGPRDKMLARVDGDPNLSRQAAITLPRMSFELTGATYDSTRKLATIQRNRGTANSGSSAYLYNPVPYNFNFQLSIAVKNAEDGTRIIEQILPFFTPEWNVTLDHVDGVNSSHDVPIILQGISTEDQYQDNFETRRALLWNLDFVLKGYLYGPSKTGKIILDTTTSFFNVDNEVEFGTAITNTSLSSIANVSVSPGQDANGAAVDAYGSANVTSNTTSVDSANIASNSTFGYIVTVGDDSEGA